MWVFLIPVTDKLHPLGVRCKLQHVIESLLQLLWRKMMADAAPQLQEAYELIESGDLESARQLLEEIRSDNENNPDFWWIYAHALEDETEGRKALERVGQLAPNYPGLSALSTQLGLRPPQPIQPLPHPVAPSTEDVDAYYESFDDDASASEGNNWLIYTGITAVIVIVVLFLLLNTLTGGNTPTDETPTQELIADDATIEPIIPTAVAESATEILPTEVEMTGEASDEPTETVTEQPDEPTLAPTDVPEDTDPFSEVYSELAIFSVPEDGITTNTSETFGETYFVTTCSPLGPIATQNILNIIDTLTPIAENLDGGIGGVAFQITDCDADSVSLTLGIDRDTLDAYWGGEITQSELQQSLVRVN